MMKFLILNVILCCVLASCTNHQQDMKSQNESSISAKIDTIYLEEEFFENFITDYTCKTEMEEGFPKNDTVFMEVKDKDKYKAISKHCNIEIEPLSDSTVIRKTDNTHFSIFIKSEYTPRIFYMSIYLQPKKNIALIGPSGEEFTMHPDRIRITTLADWVAGNWKEDD